MNNYLNYGEVQDWLTSSYNKYNTKREVQEAIRELVRKGQRHQGVPAVPDFQKWDFSNDATLIFLMQKYPIFISGSEETDGKKNLADMDTIHKDFFISLAHFYAKNEYRANESYSLIYALHGNGHIFIQDREYGLETGDFYMISPYTLFSVTAMPEDIIFFISVKESYFSITFMDLIYKDFSLSAFFRMLFQKGENNFFAFYILPDYEIRYLLQHLLIEFVTYDKYADDMSMNYIRILFSTILRRQSQQDYSEIDSPDAAAKMQMLDIIRYIEEHSNNIVLAELCRQFHYSESYLSRMIHDMTGKTFSTIVTEFRIIRAKNYLSETRLSVGEIALEVGYNSFEHFSRSFKKSTGMSPREYRKRL